MSVQDKDGVIVLGNDTVNPQNNITIKTPAIADGSLEIYKGVPGNLGTRVGRITQNGIEGGIQLGTPVAMAGKTFHDFAVPAGAKRILATLSGVRRTSTDPVNIYLGGAGGFIAACQGSLSTVLGTAASNTAVTGNSVVLVGGSASNVITGDIMLTKITGSSWNCSIVLSASSSQVNFGAANINVGQEFTLVRVALNTPVGVFDAGTVNVSWEL